NFTPVSSNSPMMAQVFVLPTSSATNCLSFLINPPLLYPAPGLPRLRDPALIFLPHYRGFRAATGRRNAPWGTPIIAFPPGFTTTCLAKRKPTEPTPPAPARH